MRENFGEAGTVVKVRDTEAWRFPMGSARNSGEPVAGHRPRASADHDPNRRDRRLFFRYPQDGVRARSGIRCLQVVASRMVQRLQPHQEGWHPARAAWPTRRLPQVSGSHMRDSSRLFILWPGGHAVLAADWCAVQKCVPPPAPPQRGGFDPRYLRVVRRRSRTIAFAVRVSWPGYVDLVMAPLLIFACSQVVALRPFGCS